MIVLTVFLLNQNGIPFGSENQKENSQHTVISHSIWKEIEIQFSKCMHKNPRCWNEKKSTGKKIPPKLIPCFTLVVLGNPSKLNTPFNKRCYDNDSITILLVWLCCMKMLQVNKDIKDLTFERTCRENFSKSY